jgi:hypothetical protein
MNENLNMPALPISFEVMGNVGLPETISFTGLTKREYAAIHLRIASSGDEQLDIMITDANERDCRNKL